MFLCIPIASFYVFVSLCLVAYSLPVKHFVIFICERCYIFTFFQRKIWGFDFSISACHSRLQVQNGNKEYGMLEIRKKNKTSTCGIIQSHETLIRKKGQRAEAPLWRLHLYIPMHPLSLLWLFWHMHGGLLWTFALAKLFEQFNKNPQHLRTGWR